MENEIVKKIDEIIESLERIKEEIDKLEKQINSSRCEEVVYNLFSALSKITNGDYNSIIYINNNTVKYISKKVEHDGFPTLIIYNNKGYSWKNYDVQNTILVSYYNEYDIPDYLLNILNNLPESPIEYSDPVFFKLYYLLKKGYAITFVKVS
jgi:hypothetical protein